MSTAYFIEMYLWSRLRFELYVLKLPGGQPIQEINNAYCGDRQWQGSLEPSSHLTISVTNSDQSHKMTT